MAAVQHIGFNCKDTKRTEQFYTLHFGFKRARVFNRDQPNEFVMLRLGNVCIEFFKSDKDAEGGEQPVGFKHLAFEVDNIEAKIHELKADGCNMGDIIDCSHISPNMKACFFKDPDGNIIELMENWADE